MTRKLIIASIAAVIGIGASAPAMAHDWNRDGRIDWRDSRRHWDHRHAHHNPHDLNRDGRIDRRDRQIARHWRDRNHDGRLDWRDNPRFY